VAWQCFQPSTAYAYRQSVPALQRSSQSSYKIASGQTSSARSIALLRQAQRRVQNPEMHEGGLDDFLNQLDIGGLGDQAKGIRRFDSPEEIVDFFRQDKPEDWRQRD
jgi:hypothetical protein